MDIWSFYTYKGPKATLFSKSMDTIRDNIEGRLLGVITVTCSSTDPTASARNPAVEYLEKNTLRRPLQISLPIEAWSTLDQIMRSLEKQTPGSAPVHYGYFLIAGIVRFRQRYRAVGDFLKTMGALLKELDGFESASPSLPLSPEGKHVQRNERELEISMPPGPWDILDGLTVIVKDEKTREIFGQLSVEAFLGYFMQFGLCWFKECIPQSGSLATTMKQLLMQIQRSGE